MMEATDLRNRDNATVVERFDFSFDRRIPIKRQVRPRAMIIVKIRGQDSS